MRGWFARLALLAVAAALVPACGRSRSSIGGLVMNMGGGEGTAGDGGTGGYIELYHYAPSDVKILAGGSVNASFTAPNPTPYLGANDVTISAASADKVWNVGDELALGSTTVTDGGTVTGLWVQAGQTLTVQPNYAEIYGNAGINSVAAGTGVYTLDGAAQPWILAGSTVTISGCLNAANDGTFTVTSVAGAIVTTSNAASVVEAADSPGEILYLLRDTVRISLAYGVLIEGTLRIDFRDRLAPGDSGSNTSSRFYLASDNLVVRGGGQILVNGKNVTGAVGGSGGYCYIYTSGGIVLQGTLDVSGGDGTSGGDSGGMDIYSSYGPIYNTGTLDSTGGNGTDPAGGGGDSSNVSIYASNDGIAGSFFNSGSVLARGGNGPAGGGGGGNIRGEATNLGSCVTSGTLDSSGGNATTNGDGGDAGTLGLESNGGAIRVTGTWNVRGGDGAGAGNGGDGNTIYLYDYEASDYVVDEYQAGEGIYFGAQVNAQGGRGANGGYGGDVYIDNSQNAYAQVGAAPTCLVGFARINLSGGKGSVNGGPGGGSSYVYNYGDYDYNDYDFYIGSVINQASWDLRGGDGTTGYGGSTSDLEFWTDYGYSNVDGERVIENTGTIDFRGGNGGTYGGAGGYLWVYCYENVRNTGAIDMSGGRGNSSFGGAGGMIELYAEGDLASPGPIAANGGDSVSDDGGSADGDAIYIYARTVTVGSVSANGGNGGTGAGDGGGDGGYIDILSSGTVLNGAVTASGGTGATAGSGGDIWIDGIRVTVP